MQDLESIVISHGTGKEKEIKKDKGNTYLLSQPWNTQN